MTRLTDNLVAYYKFSGNSTDIIGAYNGTDTSVSYGTAYGKIDQGVTQSANTGKILSNPTRTSGDHTYNCWVKASGYNDSGTWVWGDWTNTQWNFILTTTSATGFTLHFRDAGNANTLTIDSTGLSSNTWYMVSAVRSSSNVKFYINGVQVGATTTSNNPTPSGNLNLFCSGNAQSTTLYMSEFAYWSRALTADELLLLYNGGQGKRYPFYFIPNRGMSTGIYNPS